MDRLQKKCLIASSGFHLLLLVILFVGPAFLSSSSRVQDMAVLDFVPVKTVDEMMSGGGNPNAQPPATTFAPPAPKPAPAPPPPAPEPQPEKARAPEPVKEIVKPSPEPEESLVPSKESKPRLPDVSTKLVTRKDRAADAAKAAKAAEARAEARADANRRRELAKLVGEAAGIVGNSLSGGTSVELRGPGGGGVPYANFLQAIKTIYSDAWVLPEGVIDDNATTTASVTIARDGTVVTSRITRRSGNAAVDASVQATLERVRRAVPLPDSAKEDERTVTINFNVKAKRSIG